MGLHAGAEEFGGGDLRCATGDMGYTHEAFGEDNNLVTITADPGVMETETALEQRIHILVTRLMAQNCPRRFEFINDPKFDQQTFLGFMKKTTEAYTFICAVYKFVQPDAASRLGH